MRLGIVASSESMSRMAFASGNLSRCIDLQWRCSVGDRLLEVTSSAMANILRSHTNFQRLIAIRTGRLSASGQKHGDVAQIFNLLYRRFAIGCTTENHQPRALGQLAECNSAIQQIKNLRYD